jgi:hypothetical protein
VMGREREGTVDGGNKIGRGVIFGTRKNKILLIKYVEAFFF